VKPGSFSWLTSLAKLEVVPMTLAPTVKMPPSYRGVSW
jgi:hypothetical protein